jgi:hypothetical protein
LVGNAKVWCFFIYKEIIGTLPVKFNIVEYVKSIERQGLTRCDVKINMTGVWNFCVNGLDK